MSTTNRKDEGCKCHGSLHLHVEIENLKQTLVEREKHIVKMETNFLKESDKFPNGEFAALMDELLTWQDKYNRLYESHKRVQKVNQGLEDKLLKIVDKFESEKKSLHSEMMSVTKTLMEQQNTNTKLREENERCRNDLNVAIQLLQCKPSNFLPQKFDNLPLELQYKVRAYINGKTQRKLSDPTDVKNGGGSGGKTIKVPIPTFPPTAMVYSLEHEKRGKEGTTKPHSDVVSASIVAKILKEREKERLAEERLCRSCACCSKHDIYSEMEKTDTVEMEKKDGMELTTTRDDVAEIVDLISFDPSPPTTAKGPTPCSVRLQAGSNNILLDNAARYSSPILYTRRSDNDRGGMEAANSGYADGKGVFSI